MKQAIVVVLGESSTGALALFGASLAASRGAGLMLIWPAAGKSDGPVSLAQSLDPDQREAFPEWLPNLSLIGISDLVCHRLANTATPEALGAIVSDQADCLLLEAAAYDRERGHNRLDQIVDLVSCPILVLRGALNQAPERVLLALAGGKNGHAAVRMLAPLAHASRQHDTASWAVIQALAPLGLYSQALGERHLSKALASAEPDAWSKHAIVSRDPLSDIATYADSNQLMIVGSCDQLGLQRFLKRGFAAKLAERTETPVAVFRRGLPRHRRVATRLARWCNERLPQLDRDERIVLVDRLVSGSQADFDYKAMILLATLIAGLGLLLNSTAVVVGAMLVAPLMTPILGAGLALTQGNGHLMRIAMRSIGTGFLGALAIGLLLGFLVPGSGLTEELMARTAPNLLDLIVALASAIAGALAMARSTIAAALPGVAIAAALVPPVATIGIATARFAWLEALGAVLLFATNVVAIVLGSALTLWLIGIRQRGNGVPVWTTRMVMLLMVVLCALSVTLGTGLMAPRHPTAPDPIAALVADAGYQLVSIDGNIITIAGTTPPSPDWLAAVDAATDDALQLRFQHVYQLDGSPATGAVNHNGD